MIIIKGPLKVIAILPLFIAVFCIAQYQPPDIVISGNHKIIGYSEGPSYLSVSTKRREAFTRENWERLYGLEEGAASIWPKEGMNSEGLVCGEGGCRLQQGAYKIAFSSTPESHIEDCGWADILIAEDPVNKRVCNSRVIIDKFDTWKYGAHGIWLDDTPVIRRVDDETGNWPWSENR